MQNVQGMMLQCLGAGAVQVAQRRCISGTGGAGVVQAACTVCTDRGKQIEYPVHAGGVGTPSTSAPEPPSHLWQ